jgi:hypothetical protein
MCPLSALPKRLAANDVLAAGQDDTAGRNHIHVANGFADNRKRIVPDFSICTK